MSANNVVPFTPRPTADRTGPTSGPTRAGVISPPTRIDRAVYTVKETADLLSLSLGSTYTLIRDGEIPAKKLGGRWVVPKKRLHDWLNQAHDTTDEDVSRELDTPDRARRQRRA